MCLARSVPVELVGRLTLEDHSVVAPEWEGISLTAFQPLARLTRLDIGEGVFIQFLHAWRNTSERSDPFPVLNELRFHSCYIGLVHVIRDAPLSLISDPRSDVERLVDRLKRRFTAGHALEHLRLDECAVQVHEGPAEHLHEEDESLFKQLSQILRPWVRSLEIGRVYNTRQ
jgi:hypothetical protein